MLNIVRQYQNTIASPVQSSFVEWLLDMEASRQEGVIQSREYYDGIHNTQLTDRIRQFLQASRSANFTVNYCPIVVDSKADRLKVTGFSVEDTQKEMIWNWWRRNRMDRKQGIIHRAACRDGDAFVLIEWDPVANMPRFHFEPVYAGSGTMVYYSDERRDEIEMASKTWQMRSGLGAGKVVRKNLYFPDRIEKYIGHSDIAYGNWQPYEDETTTPMPGKLGIAGVNWWTHDGTELGDPLGIPIVHFKNNDSGDSYGKSDLHNVIPVQDALNKAMIDLLGTMDVSGFPLLVGVGTDSWVDVKVGPGAVAAVSASKNEADLKSIPGENPAGLLAAYNALVMEIARISGTPLSYFQASGQTPAEGTMKQQEITLIARVEKSQTDYGNAWEDCFNIARRLHNAFGTGEELDTDELIETVWKPAASRNEKEHAETLAIKVEKLGVSEEKAQEEIGYDADDIAAFRRTKMRRQALTLRRGATAPALVAGTDNEQELTQTENETGEAAREAA